MADEHAAAEGTDARLAVIRRRLDAVHEDGYSGTEALLYLINADIPYLLELAARPAPAAATTDGVDADTVRSRACEFALHTLEGEFPDEMEDTIRRAVTIGVDYGLGDAIRPASPAPPREGYLTALDRLEALWRDIEGATSLPYPGWQDDVMIVLRLAREAARGEGEATDGC